MRIVYLLMLLIIKCNNLSEYSDCRAYSAAEDALRDQGNKRFSIF